MGYAAMGKNILQNNSGIYCTSQEHSAKASGLISGRDRIDRIIRPRNTVSTATTIKTEAERSLIAKRSDERFTSN